MEKYTKEERHIIYTDALKYMLNNKDVTDFICHAIHAVHKYPIIEDYPEIYKHKPPGSKSYFFKLDLDGYNKRIEILKEAIEETK